jgi:putative ABC transport system ATP-binding protein
MSATPVIELEAITKRYRIGDGWFTALDDLSLRIDENEYVAIVGPSGSGKSTLMNLLGCLDVPDAGHYRLHGEDVAGLDEERLAIARNRAIGFIFQSFNLLPRLTALDNVALPLSYRGIGRVAARQAAQQQLEAVGLGQRAQHLPADLSGGQRQRVAIARALVTEPALLLADEPTGNLDGATAEGIAALLLALNRERGVTLLMVTHDPAMARHMDRCIEVRNGGAFDA